MKIGVISDTHIPGKSEHLPAAVLDAFRNADMIIHAGDLISLKVIEELNSVCRKLVVVSGNMDCADVVKRYPAKKIFDCLGVKIGLTHGSGAPANLLELVKDIFKTDKCDIIIFGHSHRAMNEKIGKILFFNPGSATDSLSGSASYGVIEINDKIEAKIIKI